MIKAAPHNYCLTALCTYNLPIFRYLAQKLLERHKYSCVVSIQSNEKFSALSAHNSCAEIGDKYRCTYGCPVNDEGYGICSKTMMMLYPIMEAVRSGGDLQNIGGDGKYSKNIVCPDGCVMFRLTAKPLGNENFHTGGYWKEP